MKKSLHIILFLLSLNTALLCAEEYYDRGFYGGLNFYYIDDEYKNGDSFNAQQDFVQEYKLGYLGNIYSPRLLDYTLEGLYRIEDIKADNTGSSGQTKIRSQDYKVNLSFIKDTKFPFTVYAQKTDRPVSTIYSTSSIRYEQELERYGIHGSMRFDLFTVAYGASKQKSLYDRLYTVQEIDSELYKASIRRSQKSYSYQLGYRHLEQNVNTKTLDSNTTTNDVDDTVDFTYQWKILDSLTLTSDARYTESEYYKYNAATANLNLRWMPKTKYSGTIAMSASRTDHFLESNDTRIFYDSVDTLDITQMLNYRATSSLTFTENIGYNTYKTGVTKGDNANLRLGGQYNKQLTKDTRLRISGSFDTRRNETKRESTTPSDINESTKRESYAIDTRFFVSEKLPSLRSTLNVGASYYTVRTSLDEIRDRYGANFSFTTQVSSGLRNRFDASYLNEQGRAVFLISANENQFVYRSIVRTDISEYLDYMTRLGRDGRMTAKLGVRYSDITNDGYRIVRTMPRADMNINYRFFQRLILSAGAHVDRDLSYNYMNYSGTANLNYRIRKTSFMMGYQYHKTERTDSGIAPDYQHTRFEMKLTRTF